MEEKIAKYLTSVKRCWLDGSYGTDRTNSVLRRKIAVLGLAPADYEGPERILVTSLGNAVGLLKDLNDGRELTKGGLTEFCEYCSDLGLSEEDAALILESDTVAASRPTTAQTVDKPKPGAAVSIPAQVEHEQSCGKEEDEFICSFSDDLEIYNSYRSKYHSMATESAQEFSENFYQTFKSLDHLYNSCAGVMRGYLKKAEEAALQELIDEDGIYQCDMDGFVEKFVEPNLPWDDIWETFDGQYWSIAGNAQKRMDNIGRTQIPKEAGTGVKGAVTAVAGILIWHLGVAMVGSASDSRKKARLFEDPDTRELLTYGVFESVRSVHLAYIEAFNHYSDTYIPEPDPEDEERSLMLFKNLEEERIPVSRVRQVLCEALSLNPYNEDYYEYWLDNFGDADGRLENTAQHFDVPIVGDIKLAMVEEKAGELDFSSEKEVESAKELAHFAASIGFVSYHDFAELLVEQEKKKGMALGSGL